MGLPKRVVSFPRCGKHSKITEIEHKTKNTESQKIRFLRLKNKNIQENHCFQHILKKGKFIIKILKLVKVLFKFNKNFICHWACIDRPTLLISALSDIVFLQKMLRKIPETVKIKFVENHRIWPFRKLATLGYLFRKIHRSLFESILTFSSYSNSSRCPLR